jgi:hypothetical protein
LLQDVHQRQHGATTICEDNEEAVKLANNPMASNMTKHIHIKHRRNIRELVDARIIAVVSLDTANMLEDSLTNMAYRSRITR